MRHIRELLKEKKKYKAFAETIRPDQITKDMIREFLFCLFAGLRFCDVKDLTFAQVDFSNRLLRFNQAKTAGHSSASWVNMPLSDTHLKLMGEAENGDKNQLIFPLPSHTMCLKALRHWTARAGIEKHITWHCPRHSFAVNLLYNGADIKNRRLAPRTRRTKAHREIHSRRRFPQTRGHRLPSGYYLLIYMQNYMHITVNQNKSVTFVI